MPYKKGQTGNPNGRPPKSRALTEILERAGAVTSVDVDGKSRSGKQIVARAIWEILRTGQTELRVDEEHTRRILVGEKGWFEVAKWVFLQVDGPPPKPVELSGPGGAPIVLKWQDIETDGN